MPSFAASKNIQDSKVRASPAPQHFIALLDDAFIIPEVNYLDYQLTGTFKKLYAANRPEILLVDDEMPCLLPYNGIKRIKHLGKGGFGSVHVGEMWHFDIVLGWAINHTAKYGSRLAIKLAGSLEKPRATMAEYQQEEIGLSVDARGLMRCRAGVKMEPVNRSEAVEWFAEAQVEDDLDFLVKLYFRRTIHPLSAIYKASNVNGAICPHSVVGIELLPNGTLHDRIVDSPRCISEREAWTVMRDMLLGIKQCHDSGIAHRDIKPANICFDSKDRVTLIDFGLVEELDLAGSRSLRGTPAFMAPELVALSCGRDQGLSMDDVPSMDARKLDIFAAGECLRWMLDTIWYPTGVEQARSGEVERNGFVLAESLAFLNGLQEWDPEVRWDVDQALAECEKWGLAVARNSSDPQRPPISCHRDPRRHIPTGKLISMASATSPDLTYQNVKPRVSVSAAERDLRLRAIREHFGLEVALQNGARSHALALRERERVERLAALALLDKASGINRDPAPLPTITGARPILAKGAFKQIRHALKPRRVVVAI